MYKTVYAALVGAALVSMPLAAFAQQVQPYPYPQDYSAQPTAQEQATPPVSAPTNPYAYSETAPDTWRNLRGYAAPASAANPSFAGPRPSSAH